MSVLAFVDCGEDTLVNPECHRGRDQSKGEVSQYRDDRDILDGQEDNQDGAEDDTSVPWVLPVDKVILNLRRQPHHFEMIVLT